MGNAGIMGVLGTRWALGMLRMLGTLARLGFLGTQEKGRKETLEERTKSKRVKKPNQVWKKNEREKERRKE